ncbi:mediator of DNA damage checkpoint protein 1 isoform X2 [Strongylocentrotus purpuratus]|uniref:Mediator of DNA damage checkpoint protein 1 n=1 Tax=Strongylocentrotus purpuratus TaxID=7668 RepID=A0A7M7NNG4_STRPU|nr:mediator of DNA damage checkpoint protein 1 isoform X2 [Strongylocentrotus purpuratus]
MDATQAIDFSDEESEEEHEHEPGQKKAVAFLHILAQKDVSASKHPIYEGDNFIGRHDSNSIHMPYKALSKQHACIEVQGNSHLIYDLDSRNKTRRGKMFLKPNVRYELRESDVIIFGDVKCQYIIQSEEDDDETGSETDSELMLQPPDSEDMDDKNSNEDENENETSFNLNDFLHPTQPCMPSPKLVFKTPRRLNEGKVFAADSDEESPNNSNAGRFGDDSFIPETQLSAKKKNDISAVEESDSDTDIDETGPFDILLASAQTQAVMATQAVDNMATLAVDNMETQAIDNMETQAIDNMATLAVDNMETQAVDNMATQAVDGMPTLAVDGMETQAVDNMETQAIDNMTTLAVDNMETQAVDNMATLAVDNMATLAVEDGETQAIDNIETQAIDNTATIAVDSMATQAVDYSPDSDSSDTDLDEVGQSMLEAPTQAVGLDGSRRQGTPREWSRTLVLDSSTASSDGDDSPVKQARSSRSIYDEPTQACDGIVSDSGSETDIEDRGTEAETQAVLGDSENEIDNMATVAIGQEEEEEDTTEDKETMETNSKIPITDTTWDVENMATVPIEMDDYDDDTDVEDSDDKGANSDTVKIKDMADMATIAIATANDDDDDDTDVEEGSKDEEEKSVINDTKLKDGNRDIIKEDKPIIAPSNSDHDDDNTEMEKNNSSQEYFLNYRTEQNPAAEEPPGSCEVEATQPYGGPSDDTSTEDVLSSNHGNDDGIDATQPYGGMNEEETMEEPTSATSITMALSFTQPYGTEGENKQSDSHDDDTEPIIPRETEEDIAMETGDSEIESTQAYGMQNSDTQVPDSQDGDDQPTTSSRFPDFKTQSPSKSCLKPPNTPERKATKARRVTFEPADNEEEGQESEGESQPLRRGSRSRGNQSRGEGQSSSSGSRVSRRNKDEKVDIETKDDVTSGRRSTRFEAVSDEAAAKPGRKRKVGALEPVSADSSAPATKDKSDAKMKRGEKQRGSKMEEDPNGDPVSVDEGLTMTDAKPTRKKEFDAENPRPSVRQGSKVKDERKLSDGSISSVGSEGSRAGRALKTIVQIGKKLTRMSKREKKSSEDSEPNATCNPVSDSVATRRPQRTAEVVDDGDSDDTASISSTASSVRDFAEVEPSTRPTRGTRNRKGSKKITEEHAGHVTPGARRSQRGGSEKEETTDLQESEKKAGSRTRRGGVAIETVETEVDGQSTQSRSRARKRELAIKGDETPSQDDDQGEVSTRRRKNERIHSQNDEEVSSKRTRRGTTQGVKPDVQEEEPIGNISTKRGEIPSKVVKPSTRGRAITQHAGGKEQGTQGETSVQADKESQETSTRRNRRATSESPEGSANETGETNVRHSGRRRTVPARFLNPDGKDKATGSHRSSLEQEAEDTSSSNAGVFAVPKALAKPSRKIQQKELPSSSQTAVEAETVQLSSRGRRSTAKIPEAAVEPVKEASRVSRKRGHEAPAAMSGTLCVEESKAEENKTTFNQRRGRATTRTSAAPSDDGKSEDLKEASRDSSRRGRVKPVEEPVSEKSSVTPTTRGSRAAVPAPTAKTSKEFKERGDRSTEGDKCNEVVKTRAKRGATATPPPCSPAKRPRQATIPTSQSSPSSSPATRSGHQTDQTSALSPSLRRRLSDVRPKVMFTGVMDGSWQKTVTTLGGELVDSVHECTHLITDKVRRTVKFLCCMARGIIIITPNWLEDSKTAKMFIDPGPFQLKDKASERQHGFNLQTSLQKASQARLLTGYKIHVTPGVKPEPQQMKDIITCAGAQYVAKLPIKSSQQTVVVSCDGDKSLWAGLSKAGNLLVSSEFILTGILRQDVLLKDYKLK